MNCQTLAAFSAAAVSLAAWAVPTHAAPQTLSDQNSALTFYAPNRDGATAWSVDGVNNLFYEAYFYRVNSGSAQMLPVGTFLAGCSNGLPNCLGHTFALTGYGTVRLEHTLWGGSAGSGISAWRTTLDFTQTITSAQLRFYAYADYDLGGSTSRNDDSVAYLGDGDFAQSDDAWNLLWDARLTPSHCTAREWSSSGGGIPPEASVNLNDSCAYTGNAVFMAQWDNPTDFRIIRTVQVPVPATAALLGIGLAALGVATTRKKA